uniref:Uncharacterized protein n=1 Tax=Caenorhabditis japonica TaxID=281687 RepID=A0A8R1E2D9_CAEJA
MENERKMKRQSTQNADTTMIYFDNPVWDDAKFRQELLDSDDERYSIGETPYIMDDDDTLDDILRDTHHESASNPIEHYETDETILYLNDNDSDHDRFRQPKLLVPTLRSPDAKYEKSLTDL